MSVLKKEREIGAYIHVRNLVSLLINRNSKD